LTELTTLSKTFDLFFLSNHKRPFWIYLKIASLQISSFKIESISFAAYLNDIERLKIRGKLNAFSLKTKDILFVDNGCNSEE